jgi:polyphosphate kinase
MAQKYFNREISLLEFQGRVLEEAMDEKNPLMERVKFLSIFHTNLDEFFMIRVSGLQEQIESDFDEPSEDGLTPREQLALIRRRVTNLYEISYRYFNENLTLRLAQNGIYLYHYNELSDHQKHELKRYFDTNIYPILTPLAIDPGHPFPFISNLSLNLAVVLRGPQKREHYARVKIPSIIPRFVPVTLEETKENGNKPKYAFVWLEELIVAHLQTLFSGMEVKKAHPFRVIRDADLEIREDEAGDLLQTIEKSLQRRRFGDVTQVVIEPEMPEKMRNWLVQNLEIRPDDIYENQGSLGLGDIMSLYGLDFPHLKDEPFRPRLTGQLRSREDIFRAIRANDILLHHPYDSFHPIIDFINAAANDPDVLAIKQTIYRVGSNSPIVEALAQACIKGKQVSVLVELKARFDEENNIEWARALEQAGVHVVYGRVELKTHCKVALVVRREEGKIVRYVHLGTGNYNAKTSRIYTDLGLFTAEPEIGADVSALFNSLTGYNYEITYQKLLVSPYGIRKGITERIEREIRHAQEGKEAHIIMKVNSFTDFDTADAMYKASQAGVKVDLIIRGSCCVVPGIKNLSENIRVISVVGRFLEHSRVYYFRNGGGKHQEVWLGSADVMQRNFDRRIEVLFPIEKGKLKEWVVETLLQAYLRDNQKSRLLLPNGTYERLLPGKGEETFNAQDWFLSQSRQEDLLVPLEKPRELLRVGD